jgi:endonuclease-3
VPASSRRAATRPRSKASRSSKAASPKKASKKVAPRPPSIGTRAKKAARALGTAARKVGQALAKKPPRPRALRGDASAVLERFERAIPAPHVELAFADPWQLLVATILSAQSTDRTVNRITPLLFERWPTPAALAAAPADEVEALIKPTGFFRNKTKSIRGASQLLVERFGGAVPRTMSELLDVPGVARKTANVVLGAAYGVPSGIVTDTHAMRVAQRLELTREEAPEKIEADLCRQFPERSWIKLSHRLVLHGRHLCVARAPDCPRCPLNELCPSRQAPPEGPWQRRADDEAADMAQRGASFAHPG